MLATNVPDQPGVVRYINNSHDKLLIAPVDRTSNNFDMVSKAFYLIVINKELGISEDSNAVCKTILKTFKDSPTNKNLWIHLVSCYLT